LLVYSDTMHSWLSVLLSDCLRCCFLD